MKTLNIPPESAKRMAEKKPDKLSVFYRIKEAFKIMFPPRKSKKINAYRQFHIDD